MLSKLNKMLTENGLFAIGSVGTEFPAVGREMVRLANAITLTVETLCKEQQNKFLKGKLKAYHTLTAINPNFSGDFSIEVKQVGDDEELRSLVNWLSFQIGTDHGCAKLLKQPPKLNPHEFLECLKTLPDSNRKAVSFATVNYRLDATGLTTTIESLFEEIELQLNSAYVNRELLFSQLKGLANHGFDVDFKQWRTTKELHGEIYDMILGLPEQSEHFIELEPTTLQYQGADFGTVKVAIDVEAKTVMLRYFATPEILEVGYSDTIDTLLCKLITLHYDALLEHFTTVIQTLHTK